MLYWALVFLVVAIIAGALGFGGIAGTSAGIAQILFFIFLAFLIISLLAGLFKRACRAKRRPNTGSRTPQTVSSHRRAVSCKGHRSADRFLQAGFRETSFWEPI